MHGPIEEVYRRIQRNRILEIKFLDNMEAGVSIIRSLPETRDVQVENHKVTVELAAGDQQIAALLERHRRRRRADALFRRERAHAGRRVHAGHERAGDLRGANAKRQA